MKLRFQKSFEKSYKKLLHSLKEKTRVAIKLFAKNPLNPKLKNHALGGKMKGKRAFSVTGNVRIVFQEFDDYTLVLMLKVGTHNQVYG